MPQTPPRSAALACPPPHRSLDISACWASRDRDLMPAARRKKEAAVKITDITLTLFAWESIPSTIYGHHTARPTGKSDLGLLRVVTDEGIEGHAFLGTSSNPASLDGPGLIRFLKPLVMGQDPLDRERLNKLLWARARVATVRSIGAVDIALWDIAGKKAGLPIHRLLGTARDKIGAYASSEIHASREAYVEQALHYQ